MPDAVDGRSRPGGRCRPGSLAAALAGGLLGVAALAGCGPAQAGSVDAATPGMTTAAPSAPATAPGPAAPDEVAPDQADPTAQPSPTATRYAGPVLAVGDSVMLGAVTCLQDRRIKVDADESRSFWAMADLLGEKAAAGRLAERIALPRARMARSRPTTSTR